MKYGIVYTVIVLFAAGAIWYVATHEPPAPLPLEPVRVWVSIEPTQCSETPWELEWLNRHPDDPNGQEYVREHEEEIVTAFYESKGIRVLQAKKEVVHEIVCTACSCPRGDRISLLVPSAAVATMEAMGFVRSEF